MPNRYDVTLDGTQYRLIRGEGSYRQGSKRASVDIQEIGNMPGSQLTSRGDLRTAYQTSWIGGSHWEKPMLTEGQTDTYYLASDFDMFTEPGNLIPWPMSTGTLSTTHEANHTKWVQVDGSTAYAVGKAGASYYTVIKWDNGTVTSLTQHSNVAITATPVDACWDDTNSTLYILSTAGIEYCTPGSGQGHVATAGPVRGAALFMHLGDLHYWSGEKLYKISDPTGTPSTTTVYSDGFASDWLRHVTSSAASRWHFPWSSRLAISTSDGIFLAKNVTQHGVVQAYIYRIDQDASGTDIGTPVATLAPGYVALDIYWSLGSLLVSATSGVGVLATNDASADAPRVDFFHLTNNSLGSVGSPNGNSPDEFVFKMLTTSANEIYIGGSSNVWVYDAVRGGIHTVHSESLSDGHYSSAIVSSSGVHLFHGGTTAGLTHVTLPYSSTTTTGNTSTLQSSYFDFALPGEEKYITEVTLMLTTLTSGETWTVELECDDGSWTTVGSVTSGGTQTINLSTPKSGYRFRYKVSYSKTSATIVPSKLKGIIFRAMSGRMVPFWQMMIDGTEAFNVENGVVRPDDVFDHLKSLRTDKSSFTFIDGYESIDRSDSTSYTVRLDGLSIVKEEPKEAVIEVLLVGV